MVNISQPADPYSNLGSNEGRSSPPPGKAKAAVGDLAQKGVEILGDAPLGHGNFGEVWKGKLKGQLVALKFLFDTSATALAELTKEIGLLR